MNILDEIAAYTRTRVDAAKKILSLEDIKAQALAEPKGDFSFQKALGRPGLSFILECKKASPSKGLIAENFDYLNIAKDYERIGADSVSVLTEPKWFLGSNDYIREIASAIKIPVLRKDFTVDEYMIYEAKLLGASAVLLIVSVLSAKQLEDYLSVCERLGLSALVEVHDENEAKIAVSSGAKIIGVNNRNLKDFSVDTGNSARLREKIGDEVLFVSESGVKDSRDIKKLIEIGADAVLIGETMMRATDRQAAFAALKS